MTEYLIETYLNKKYFHSYAFTQSKEKKRKGVVNITGALISSKLNLNQLPKPKNNLLINNSIWEMQAQELEESLPKNSGGYGPCKGIISNDYLNKKQINANALMIIVRKKTGESTVLGADEGGIVGFAVCKFTDHLVGIPKSGGRGEYWERQHYLYIDVLCSSEKHATKMLWTNLLKFVQINHVDNQNGWLHGIQLSALSYVVPYYYKKGFRFYNIDTTVENDKLDIATNNAAEPMQNIPLLERNNDRDKNWLTENADNERMQMLNAFVGTAWSQGHSVYLGTRGTIRRSETERGVANTYSDLDPGNDGWTMFLKNTTVWGCKDASTQNGTKHDFLNEMIKKQQGEQAERKVGGKRTEKKALKKRHQVEVQPNLTPEQCESSRKTLKAFEKKVEIIKKALLQQNCPINKIGGRKKRKTRKKRKKRRRKTKKKKKKKKRY